MRYDEAIKAGSERLALSGIEELDLKKSGNSR
jgi:hypothetical protein